MENMEISKELKEDIENKQNELKNAIRNHQILMLKSKEDPDNVKLQKQIQEARQKIISIGIEQKTIIDRLRREFRHFQRSVKLKAVKNGIEDRRFNLTSALNRARKQNIITRSTSVASLSPSDESEISGPITPEPTASPLNPHDLQQTDFLSYFGLATHDVFKEMQNRRVERKRRSTANPQFLYAKGWDLSNKRRRNLYLASNISPPNTRQSVKNKKLETRASSPPLKSNSRPNSPPELAKKISPFPSIPNLPSGLTIERVGPGFENKVCVECKLSGNLVECELCKNGFHVNCFNRPLVQSPKQCPRCYSGKEVRSVGALTVPSGMSVSFVTTNITEKIQERDMLLEKNKNLNAELTELQDKHSVLTLSLKNQNVQRGNLLTTEQNYEDKIKKVVEFIEAFKQQINLNNDDDDKDTTTTNTTTTTTNTITATTMTTTTITTTTTKEET